MDLNAALASFGESVQSWILGALKRKSLTYDDSFWYLVNPSLSYFKWLQKSFAVRAVRKLSNLKITGLESTGYVTLDRSVNQITQEDPGSNTVIRTIIKRLLIYCWPLPKLTYFNVSKCINLLMLVKQFRLARWKTWRYKIVFFLQRRLFNFSWWCQSITHRRKNQKFVTFRMSNWKNKITHSDVTQHSVT